MEAQEAMAMENQGEHSPPHSNHGGMHSIQGLDNNGQPTNVNIVHVSSPGESVDGQNVATTVMSSTNGNHHHSPESLQECGSPEMQQTMNQMPLTPITPNSEMDLSRVKQEPEPMNMNVIVKQEVITGGQGGELS